jgi:hypothetical protein
LQLYLDKGLLKSDFVNLKIRKFSAETSHEFAEWCGVIGGQTNDKINAKGKIHMNELYNDFINEYPDYAPKAKMTISRQRFSKWVLAYSNFKHECLPVTGRDQSGKWVEFVNKHYYETQGQISL